MKLNPPFSGLMVVGGMFYLFHFTGHLDQFLILLEPDKWASRLSVDKKKPNEKQLLFIPKPEPQAYPKKDDKELKLPELPNLRIREPKILNPSPESEADLVVKPIKEEPETKCTDNKISAFPRYLGAPPEKKKVIVVHRVISKVKVALEKPRIEHRRKLVHERSRNFRSESRFATHTRSHRLQVAEADPFSYRARHGIYGDPFESSH